ncbi:hypothetical protein V502_04361 [Pseudogymnoascus sp. VKM F-4520 (FW-2644)]|nr:hypothetical protein V502_04361 [Pseudogymnoascus sp. VKM F-4520 (FW-2644)]
MSDKQEPTVSEDEESTAEVRTVLKKYYLDNEEYQTIICTDEGCGRAVDPWYAGTHLRKTHNVSKVLTKRITKTIREGGMGWKGHGRGIPEDESRPQEGIAVFDGVRCKCCGQFKARSVQEVEEHWRWAEHEETTGSMIERVRIQSWGGRKGADQRYWVVDEDKCGGSEDERLEKDRKEESWGGVPEDSNEDSNEESEAWGEEKGQVASDEGKEMESLEEWVEDCPIMWRRREDEWRTWTEIAGDWVVVY